MSKPDKLYSVQDALELIIDGDQSDFESSDDDEEELNLSGVEKQNIEEEGECEQEEELSEEEEERLPVRKATQKERKWEKIALEVPNIPFLDVPTDPPAAEDLTP